MSFIPAAAPAAPMLPIDDPTAAPEDAPKAPYRSPDAPASESAPVRRPPYWFLIAAATGTFLADVLSKLWAVATFQAGDAGQPIPVIDGYVELVLHHNTGGAWSLFHDAPDAVRLPFFIAISILAVVLIVIAYKRLGPALPKGESAGRWAARWGFALVLGGALGNLVDRIRDSAVIDFVRVHAWWGERITPGRSSTSPTWRSSWGSSCSCSTASERSRRPRGRTSRPDGGPPREAPGEPLLPHAAPFQGRGAARRSDARIRRCRDPM